MIRQRVRNPNGQLGAIEYTILEKPRQPEPGKPERKIQSWIILNRLPLSWENLNRETPHN